MKILVTGSRWATYEQHYATIARGIGIGIETLRQKYPNDNVILVRHGACPKRSQAPFQPGVDQLTVEFVNKIKNTMRSHGINVDHKGEPANWQKYGLAAGPVRNQLMVDEKPELVIGFPLMGVANKGTNGCLKMAKNAGLEVMTFNLTS